MIVRGRPSREKVEERELQGKGSNDPFKCPFCDSVFPRGKSLQAHKRTHTGETPYKCTFPGCTSAFKQSGQLKSHFSTHTGEKPFACPTKGCKTRFAHVNRKCPQHTDCKLIRDGREDIYTDIENMPEEQIEWLQRYKEMKKNAKKTSKENDETNATMKRKVKNLGEDVQNKKFRSSEHDDSESFSETMLLNTSTSFYVNSPLIPEKKLCSSLQRNYENNLNCSLASTVSESETSSGYDSSPSSDFNIHTATVETNIENCNIEISPNSFTSNFPPVTATHPRDTLCLASNSEEADKVILAAKALMMLNNSWQKKDEC